ncbi:MAG: transcriptional regulator [Subtercola sp.]|nr:transcriptional regulator [Subtercola sp.]
MGISRYRLAQAIEVSPRRINEIVRGTPESARRPRFVSHALLAPLTCTGSTLYWIDLQNHYDLDREREAHGPELDRIPLLLSA